MKKKHLLLLLISLSMLIGCTATCQNQIKTISFINNTNDTLCISIGFYIPTSLDTILPFSKYVEPEIYTDHLDYKDIKVYIATLETIDRHGMEIVLKNQLYDTIMYYCRSELESMNYVVRFSKIQIE